MSRDFTSVDGCRVSRVDHGRGRAVLDLPGVLAAAAAAAVELRVLFPRIVGGMLGRKAKEGGERGVNVEWKVRLE